MSFMCSVQVELGCMNAQAQSILLVAVQPVEDKWSNNPAGFGKWGRQSSMHNFLRVKEERLIEKLKSIAWKQKKKKLKQKLITFAL